ncbi:unnamed protein product [Prorocentrum cordatum]|uniref:Apple domain-containing protein n=1 Tax=Prorocentrum cordatum TaxID=2364126 RepID=A0ABN9WLE9_9DINO|nr:unnamed protein product [Polarella glacialis]
MATRVLVEVAASSLSPWVAFVSGTSGEYLVSPIFLPVVWGLLFAFMMRVGAGFCCAVSVVVASQDDQAEDAEPGTDVDGLRQAAPAAGPHRAFALKAACLGLAASALLAAALRAAPRPGRGVARRSSQIDEDSVVALVGSPSPHPVSIDDLLHDRGPSGASPAPGPSAASPGPAPPVVHSGGSDVKAATSCRNLDQIALGEGKLKTSTDECHSWCQGVGGCVGFQFQAEEKCPQLGGEPALLGIGACVLLLGACEEQPSSCFEVHAVQGGKAPRWNLKGDQGRRRHRSSATLPSCSPFWASWEVPLATVGFASRLWSERTVGEVRGGEVRVHSGFRREHVVLQLGADPHRHHRRGQSVQPERLRHRVLAEIGLHWLCLPGRGLQRPPRQRRP